MQHDIDNYPLYTALLSGSRWIGNPINHSSTTVSVSPSCLSAHLPSLHCTVIEFPLDWESHKSLKHDYDCLTELLERACFQPYPIQRSQLAEVGWESDKGFERKRGWVVCIKSCATFSVLV